MKRLLLLSFLALTVSFAFAKTIIVKNITELNAANKEAQPGDLIILQNGEWKNVAIALDCKGTKDHPITFRAQTAGKVIICGQSSLKLGGDYIVVDGLSFVNGYAGKDHVIDFRSGKDKLANNCRVTNCVVNDFNNPKRMQENYWVSFYGKNNRVDHCTFLDKKNMGVLLAVILDDERSRENFHSIDHNYFGKRIPLASNSGEIMRVGVSQHCQFNSNTQIVDNFFEHCDGETEIVSIKSGSNVVRNNLFKECQGGVVLRHGDNNTVENNIFLGNDKPGTGGVRVINKGQWVINNFFYRCRGVDFRSPLSVMNGIPNSPAHRYVQVTDAVIANNTFYNCSSISFGEGSDAERSLAPENVVMANNIFYNTQDSIIYRAFDKITGFDFNNNMISQAIPQNMPDGFMHARFRTQTINGVTSVNAISGSGMIVSDSLQKAAELRLKHKLSSYPGFSDAALAKKVQDNAYQQCGAAWFNKIPATKAKAPLTVTVKNASELYQQIQRPENVVIKLAGGNYDIDRPILINKQVSIVGDGKSTINFTSKEMPGVFMIGGNSNLDLKGLVVNGAGIKAKSFVCSDTSGSSGHYNFRMQSSTLKNFDRKNGCENLFFAYKSMVADSLVFRNNLFTSNSTDGILLNDEKDDKGYYNAEKMFIGHNNFEGLQGVLLSVYRGGNDESTLGPDLTMSHNKIKNCSTVDNSPLIQFTGVQRTNLFSNEISNANTKAVFVSYKDTVRARHLLTDNRLTGSGKVEGNMYLSESNNIVR